MQHINSLDHPPIIGETYIVPYGTIDEMIVPIIGKLHRDPVLGQSAINPHVHIDIRFIHPDVVINVFYRTIESIYPNLNEEGWFTILVCDRQDIELENKEMEMVCLREGQDIPFKSNGMYQQISSNLCNQAKLEDLMKNRKMKQSCKVCPHHGIPLGSTPVRNGIRTCPGHLLDWSEKTGRLVRRSQWINEEKTRARHSTEAERVASPL
jgi:hypothetical protein